MKNAEKMFFKAMLTVFFMGMLFVGSEAFAAETTSRVTDEAMERQLLLESTRAIHEILQHERAEKRKKTKEEILKRFVSAVAKFDCPDYTHTDGDDVIETFSAAFNGENINDDWLKDIQERVNIESEGRIVVNISFRVHWLFVRHVRLIASAIDGKTMEYLVIADHRQSIACSMSEEEKNTQRVFMKVLGQESQLTSNGVTDSR